MWGTIIRYLYRTFIFRSVTLHNQDPPLEKSVMGKDVMKATVGYLAGIINALGNLVVAVLMMLVALFLGPSFYGKLQIIQASRCISQYRKHGVDIERVVSEVE